MGAEESGPGPWACIGARPCPTRAAGDGEERLRLRFWLLSINAILTLVVYVVLWWE
jgi:hypothetical protein